jgi:general stress protein 26
MTRINAIGGPDAYACELIVIGGFKMDQAFRDKVLELLDQHRILTLATLRADGWPQATTVGYVSRGLTIWFMTGKDAQKAKNLARDSRVSLTIDHDTSDPGAIVGLSMAARAFPVTDERAIRDVMFTDLPKKYPEYTSMMGDLDISGVAVFELRPEVISLLDYTKGFGHTDEVIVEEADRKAA